VSEPEAPHGAVQASKEAEVPPSFQNLTMDKKAPNQSVFDLSAPAEPEQTIDPNDLSTPAYLRRKRKPAPNRDFF